jgi:hypothetical protein
VTDWQGALGQHRTDRLKFRKINGIVFLVTMMKQSVVVMPTLHRPEMLALALEKLSNVPEKNELDVRIYLDSCDDTRLSEVDYVRDNYFPEATIFKANTHILGLSGCWNILNALKQGYHTGADHIYLVEEDCMVYPNFVSQHRFNLSSDYFASCGRFRKEYLVEYYTNPGSCFPRESLRQVVPHINDSFFHDTKGYMDRFFGAMDEASILDDGLIRRVIRAVNGRIIYPPKPIVAHQGFRAYNRYFEYMNEGNIQERIKNLRAMLLRVSANDRYTRDFEAFDL